MSTMQPPMTVDIPKVKNLITRETFESNSCRKDLSDHRLNKYG
jgi:hypothetical protein